MKKLLFIITLIVAILGCKKDSANSPTNSPTPPPPVIITQDPDLKGKWVQDSARYNGTTYKDSVSPTDRQYDTIYITSNSYTEVLWVYTIGFTPPYQKESSLDFANTWQTSGDSLFTDYQTYDNWHYKYTITGNRLFLDEPPTTYSTPYYLNPNVIYETKYYYHKIN